MDTTWPKSNSKVQRKNAKFIKNFCVKVRIISYTQKNCSYNTEYEMERDEASFKYDKTLTPLLHINFAIPYGFNCPGNPKL